MDKVYAACDNLFTEIDHLDRIVGDELHPDGVELALMVAKRVRRASNITVRELAIERDKATAQEAQAND